MQITVFDITGCIFPWLTFHRALITREQKRWCSRGPGGCRADPDLLWMSGWDGDGADESQEEEPSCQRLSKAAAGAGSNSAVQSHPLGPSCCLVRLWHCPEAAEGQRVLWELGTGCLR